MPALESEQIQFAKWTPKIGTYTITVFITLTGDENHSNDTIVGEVTVENPTKAYCYNAYDPTSQIPMDLHIFILRNQIQLFQSLTSQRTIL